MFTGPAGAQDPPNYPTGWEAQSYSSVSSTVPNNWTAGRIWGRVDCDFSITTGPTCLSGWCNGGLLCNPTTGTGVPPATVAEWTLQGDNDEDYYDVSLVDGFNLPMQITNNVGCPVAGCSVNLDPICPAALEGPANSSGSTLGCQSACDANLDGDPTNSANCCTGSHSTAVTCPSSGVEYYSFFKGNCPDTYAYAYDESSGTALWTCNSGLNADYTLTFCPSNATTSSSSVGPSATLSSKPSAASSSSSSASSGRALSLFAWGPSGSASSSILFALGWIAAHLTV
ncbi:hypothetical protein AcV5_009615 [Taiwanofungus camphoratus]|nr:hypothetical protein AcV5_009615 [Antrodia cinnamomea]